jgi:hypothetical protein
MSNVSTATKKDIRKSTAGQKEVERKAKDPGRSQKRKNPRKKQPAMIEEGVWMTMVNNSDDEHMADDKFNDFTISEDDIFFSEEEEEEEIQGLTNHLKKQLKIAELAKLMYSYNDWDFMLDTHKFSDSSDDEDNAGAAAMTIDSENEEEVEVDPYWTKIKVDKLQGIGNPMEILLSDTDSESIKDITTFSNEELIELAELIALPSELLTEDMNLMPDLESILESEELIVFIFTPVNTLCTQSSEKGSLEEDIAISDDEEPIKLVIDNKEEALTSFNAAMLVNVEGSIEGMQTELYNLGALQHMSPY